jgi:hypothetical protein
MGRLRGRVVTMTVSTGLLAVAVVSAGVLRTEAGSDSGLQHSELIGWAVLPATTLGESVPSGSFITPGTYNGVVPPFPAQPVQGFSGVLRNDDGTYLVMSDNGYGLRRTVVSFCFECITSELIPSMAPSTYLTDSVFLIQLATSLGLSPAPTVV